MTRKSARACAVCQESIPDPFGSARLAIEAMRQGMMFMTVVEARTQHSKDEVSELTGAYIGAFMPGEKATEGTDHERADKAVRDRLGKLEEKAKRAAETPATAPATDAKSAVVEGAKPDTMS